MSLWSRLWDWLEFKPKEPTQDKWEALKQEAKKKKDPLGWKPFPRECYPNWPKFERGWDQKGGDIVVEEGPSLSPYVSKYEDLPQKWAEDYVDTLPPLDPRVVSEHSINPEAGHRLREFGDWSPITQVPLKPRRKAAKRKTPKKATSPKPKGSKQRPASPKKPQKVPKGKARSKS